MTRLRAAAAVVPLAVLAACSATGSAAGPADRTTHARAVPSAHRTAATPGRAVTIAALLAARSRAVADHDPAGYLATDDPLAPAAFLDREKAVAQALSGLAFDAWQVTLGAGGPLAGIPGRLAAHHADETWLPPTELHYRWHGGDGTTTSSRLAWTYVRRGTHWYVGADDDAAAGQADREIWDFGPVHVASGTSSLVLFHSLASGRVSELVTDLDAAVPAVARVWGSGWPRRVVALVPATDAEFQALARAGNDLGGDAAVESADVGSGEGTRIVVDPPVLFGSSRLASSIVLTHETTHVATAADTGAGMPTWLVEGFADYVAFGSVDVEPAAGAADLLRQVGAHGAPSDLPRDSDFDAVGSARDLAYAEGWTACRTIAERVGSAGLARFYRLVGTGTPLGTAFGTVLHEDRAQLVTAWQRDLDRLAGHPS